MTIVETNPEKLFLAGYEQAIDDLSAHVRVLGTAGHQWVVLMSTELVERLLAPPPADADAEPEVLEDDPIEQSGGDG